MIKGMRMIIKMLMTDAEEADDDLDSVEW